MHRRSLILGGAALLGTPLFSSDSLTQEQEVPPPPDMSAGQAVTFAEGTRVPTLEEYEEILASLTGKENPYPKEVKFAKLLLRDIPTQATPYEIAYEFYKWRWSKFSDQEIKARKLTPERLRQYAYHAHEWPVRGNPVIMQFFDATGLRTPTGDTTYWCAAFVCWCIRRSQMGKGINEPVWPYKFGAGSASFRNWGTPVTNPQKGDLVVFKSTSKQNPWRGHIGFFESMSGNVIRVLGGNQGAQNERNGGEVNIANFNTKSNSLELVGYMRHEALV